MKRGRSLFSWQLRGLISAFVILVLSQVVILAIGMRPVLNSYAAAQLTQLERLATEIIINPDRMTEPIVVHSGSFFVFSADKTMIYSNRGRGRAIPEEEYRPIRLNGRVVGYFYTDEVRFLSSVSNRAFLISLMILIASSMLLSVGIAAIAAIRMARRVSDSVIRLQTDIRQLGTLNLVPSHELGITELTEMSSDINQVSTLLAGEEDYKRQWMQNIAHDVRTPISGLRAQLEGMRDGVLQITSERLDRTLEEVGRLEEMVSSMAELRTIEEMKQVQTESIATAELSDELRTRFDALLDRNGSSLATRCEVPVIHGDRGLLTRALVNIVTNAISHGGPNTNIEIGFHATDDQSVITVSNDGGPVPEDQLPRLFQRFYRGDTSRATPGSGLGLNITSQIVQRHGGAIRVENLNPTGVKFTIELPNQAP